MVINNSFNTQVYWVGSNDPTQSHKRLQYKKVKYYRKCIFNNLIIEIGDHVLISNADAAEPDSLEGCDIAKIVCLYELQSNNSKQDPCRAIVQWYSKPEKIPDQALDDSNIGIDFDLEVIQECRPFDEDVSIETFYKKCYVFTCSISDTPSDVFKHYSKKGPMFVCRYKLIKEKSSYRLIPLMSSDTDEKDIKKRNIKLTPKSKNFEKNKSKSPITKTNSITKEKLLKELEFVDVNSCEKTVVSPIRIVGNSIIRKNDYNSPAISDSNSNFATSVSEDKKRQARRNLNISLDNEETDILNYSIVNDPESTTDNNDIKIKLRLSGRNSIARRNSKDDLQDSLPSSARRSGRLSTVKCYAEEGSPKESITKKRPIVNHKDSTKYLSTYSNTPSKKTCLTSVDHLFTPKSVKTPLRRKSILKTPSGSGAATPKKTLQFSEILEEHLIEEDNKNSIKNTPRRRKTNALIEDYENYTPKKSRSHEKKSTSSHITGTLTPTQKLKLIRSGDITPSIDKREINDKINKTKLQLARDRLHVSAVPKDLPCRENEFNNIFTFLEMKIRDKCGGCMYVSGVPGTGKTATVSAVIRILKMQAEQKKVPSFEFIEINGMRLTEPRQAYVQIYKQLTGKTVAWEHAHALLEKRFTTPAPRRITTILLVDELDILCNRRQDVVYNLLDWPSKSAAQLVVLTIANTMDLPERLLKGKVTSRLGLTRLTFQPYSHKQLREIVSARLTDFEAFNTDAVQLVARKVAAVSGDARRALDICRRATEIAEEDKDRKKDFIVGMNHVQQALTEMIASVKVQAIKNCSKFEQIFLQAVSAEVARTGVEETNFMGVYVQMESLTAFMGVKIPNPGRALEICAKLGAQRLLICEHSRADIYQKILLNVSSDDIHFALQF